jgi:hypothetical protein
MKQKLTKFERRALTLPINDEIAACLTCLREDLEALKVGTWVPDEASCEASLQMLAKLEHLVGRLPCDS